MLYIVPVGIVVQLILVEAGNVVVIIAALLTIVSDTYFSIGVTRVFLKTVMDALAIGQGQAHTQAFKDLRNTKHASLIGSFVTVFSSSLLYFNGILWAAGLGPFVLNPWLNLGRPRRQQAPR